MMCHVITSGAARTLTSPKQPRNVYRIRRLDGMFLESSTAGSATRGFFSVASYRERRSGDGVLVVDREGRVGEATPTRPYRLPPSALNNKPGVSRTGIWEGHGARALEKRRPLLWSIVGILLYPLYLVGCRRIHHHPLHHPHFCA